MYAKLRAVKKDWNQDHLFLGHIKRFWKSKNGSESSLPASFSA